MKFCVATALFASVALTATFDVVSAADKAKNGKKVNNANDRKKGAIPRLNKAAGAVDDKVLAEDEGYWERFLQDADSSITPPPTPTPGTCDTEVRKLHQKQSLFALAIACSICSALLMHLII